MMSVDNQYTFHGYKLNFWKNASGYFQGCYNHWDKDVHVWPNGSYSTIEGCYEGLKKLILETDLEVYLEEYASQND